VPVTDEGYQPFPDIAAWVAAPFDPMTYEQYAALLDQARADATEEARDHAVRTAIRYAGTDTGAIEGLYTTDRGFTRTVAIEAAHWEAAAAERGPNAAALIKDQIATYEWLLDLVTESRPVTEHVIREVHAMLCRSQDTYVVHTELGTQERPLPKGEYKRFPNNPTSLATGKVHHYAPPDLVAPEVHRLVESLSSEEYQSAHPIVQAAYLHYGLVAIHPFADGNGRVSRALASVPLYRALRIPLVVFRDERDEYLDALGRTDGGDLASFVRFVAERAIDAADLVTLTMRAGPVADEVTSLARLGEVVASFTGRTRQEVDALADRLLDAVAEQAHRRTREVRVPPGVTCNARDLRGPTGRREVRVDAGLEGQFAGPGGWLRVRVVDHGADDLSFVLDAADQPSVQFAPRDLEPTVREVARIKISTLVDAAVSRAIEGLAAVAETYRGKPRG
jgi:Fic family protein